MFRFSLTSLIIIVLFSWRIGNAQQPVLVLKSFDYLWQQDYAAMSSSTAPRIVIASGDSAKLLIRNSFARALQDRWGITMPEAPMTVKPASSVSFFSNATPKFNTKLKDKKPGTWYLFLRVFESGEYSNSLDVHSFFTKLELKCKMVDGTNDAVIIDRTLIANIYREPEPMDQLLLARLPAYPPSFLMAFDSLTTWLFQAEPINQKSITLKPACVFQGSGTGEKPLAQLSFRSDFDSIHHLTAPAFSFRTLLPNHETIDKHKNTGGHIAGGALTLITGLPSSKSKSIEYRADFKFVEVDSIYHCFIEYEEVETAYQQRERVSDPGTGSSLNDKELTSSGYELVGRLVDSNLVNMITQNQDTLADFRISYENEIIPAPRFDQMWDGTDSATIVTLPLAWSSKKDDTRVVVRGNSEGNSFRMETTRETRIEEFYINDKLVMIMFGKSGPVRAVVIHPISTHQLKLFTIFSSLPYAYFTSNR